jgi:hypothetical protein
MKTAYTFQLPPDKFDIFYFWFDVKINAYAGHYHKGKFDPAAPPKKNITKGKYWPSWTKYATAVGSVLHGTKFKIIKRQDSLDTIGFHEEHKPSVGTFQVWRTQKQFKKLVQELRDEYADYIAAGILGDFVFPIYDTRSTGLLARQRYFIRESLHYAPDLTSEIAAAMAKRLNSKKAKLELQGYLGYYMYCINLIGGMVAHSRKKTRWRTVHLEAGKKILGCHWKNQFLLNYFANHCHSTATVKKWHQKRQWTEDPKRYGETHLKMCQDDLAEGRFLGIQHRFNYEFRSIIKAEIYRLERNENELSPDDITTAVDFIGGG